MKNSKLTWILTIFLTILIQACATPQYKTFYNYDPPTTAEGRSCTFQCENTKMSCEQLDQMRVNNCQQMAEMNYQNCETRADTKYNQCVASGQKYCAKDWCTKQECEASSQCDNQYQRCYSTCGGKVTSQTRCVANCQPN